MAAKKGKKEKEKRTLRRKSLGLEKIITRLQRVFMYSFSTSLITMTIISFYIGNSKEE